MPRAMIEVSGNCSRWSVSWQATQDQIDAMRADGIDVNVIENSIPAAVADAGLGRIWCFFQDIWNLKNPLKG